MMEGDMIPSRIGASLPCYPVIHMILPVWNQTSNHQKSVAFLFPTNQPTIRHSIYVMSYRMLLLMFNSARCSSAAFTIKFLEKRCSHLKTPDGYQGNFWLCACETSSLRGWESRKGRKERCFGVQIEQVTDIQVRNVSILIMNM